MSLIATMPRVLATAPEYDAYLRMRARVWGVSGNPSDLNGYDRRAHVLGVVGIEGRLEAALRLVAPGGDSAGYESLRQAAVRQGFGGEQRLETPAPCRISAEESFPITSILDQLESRSRRYAEIGRLMKPEGGADPWAVVRLVKFSFQEAGRLGFHVMIAMCAEDHLRPWKRYGFERMPGIPVQIERYTGVASVPIWVRLSDRSGLRSE